MQVNRQARDEESGICLGQRSAHVFWEGQRVKAVAWRTKRQDQGYCEVLDTRRIFTVLLGKIHNLTVEGSFLSDRSTHEKNGVPCGGRDSFPFTEVRMGAPVTQVRLPTLIPACSPARFPVFHL